MKVYKSGYRDHWVSPYTILETVLFWKDWENISYETPWVERWSERIKPLCCAYQKVLDIVHPKIDYVKIDRYDTWSMDTTLSNIILPMLRQLQATKHGSPLVSDDDVPLGVNLRSTEAPPKENPWDTDENHHKRWDWVLSEMIWAFEQISDGHSEQQFFDHSAYDKEDGTNDQRQWLEDMSRGESKVVYDKQRLQVWQDRKRNGFRLFGVYYEALWD